MKNLIVIVLYLSFVSSTIAQKQKMNDVIYLKDGGLIHGKIIENSPDKIKIESCCGNIIVFSQSEVEKIEKETDQKTTKKIKQKGYINFTSMGLLVGSTVNEKVAPFSALMEHDYKLNKYFAIGGVFGIELLKEPVCPIAINLKGFLPLGIGDLFLGTSGGYSLSTENPVEYGIKDGKGGYLFNLEIGYVLPVSDNSGFFTAIGYRYNELNYKMEDWWMNSADRKIYFNRISIRTGINFY
jgi:hypothetical protein